MHDGPLRRGGPSCITLVGRQQGEVIVRKGTDKLASALDRFDEAQRAATVEAAEAKSEHEQFLESFHLAVRDVVRPVMEEICSMLRARGHDAEILETFESVESDGRTKNAGITLRIYPLKQKPSYPNEHSCPHWALMVNSYKRSVYAHESTMMPGRGGYAGSSGEYSLEQITRSEVEEKIVDLISKALLGR